MAESWKEHQQKLAASGHRVPDSFYVAAEAPPSVEQKSGDGGQSQLASAQGSEKDAPPVAEASEVEVPRTVDPETGQTIPDAARKQAAGEESPKKGAAPKENKASK